jgi:23S rRNA (guanosine2251-2'-O)-methyltransferase
MPSSISIALDDIRSHHNVGSCFRSADAFGINELILGGITPRPPHRDIQKTALGATESVAWSHHTDLLLRCKELQDEGYRIIAVEQASNSIPLSEVKLDSNDKLVLVFGNEVKGVSNALLEVADEVWEIAQVGIKKSLNISVCAGICMHFVCYRSGK